MDPEEAATPDVRLSCVSNLPFCVAWVLGSPDMPENDVPGLAAEEYFCLM